MRVFTSVLDLTASRLERLAVNSTGTNDGFTLSKNGESIEFSVSETGLVDLWISKLRSVCILNDFHREYDPIKMIGKGAFAKVRELFLCCVVFTFPQ